MKRLFLFTMMCLVGLFSLNAQTRGEVIVAEGAYTVMSADDYSPICTGYEYSYAQQIYTAAELQGQSGSILSVAFKFEVDATSVQFVNQIDLYLKNTDKSSFGGDEDWVSLTDSDRYFSGEVVYANHKEGWLTMELNAPFEYTGGNLLVCVDNNTGSWGNNVHFYRYDSGSESRAKIVYRDGVNLSSDNIAEYAVYTKVPKNTDGSYTNPLAKFNITGKVLPLAVNHETLEFGYRPNNAWMAPIELELSATSSTVNVKSVTNENEYFQVSSDVVLPAQLEKGNHIVIDVKHGTGEGAIADELKIAYDDAEMVVAMNAVAYTPTTNDVYELASTITTFPVKLTPNFNELYDNYALPGTRKDGKDVVYRFDLKQDAIIEASVEGVDGKIALYKGDFAGKGGPMANNSFVPINYSSTVVDQLRFVLAAGEYYLVASATEQFSVNINRENLAAPEQARIYNPTNGETDVVVPVELNWSLGSNTTEYQVLLGTTNPPTNILIDWTKDLTESYVLADAKMATRYYWRVNCRNTTGTTIGEVASFSTPMSIPQNVVANPLKTYIGETITLTWDVASFTTGLLGYNVYVNGVKHNESVVETTTYTLNDLEYNKDGHQVSVTSVYESSETDLSEAVTVFVAGLAKVSGKVYSPEGTVVANAALTFVGVDEIGNEQTYNVTSDAEGAYEIDVYSGEYVISAKSEDYEINNHKVTVEYGLTNNIDVTMHEIYYPVKWVDVTANETSVDVEWNMGFTEDAFENFEIGSFAKRNWKNDGAYPWVITEKAFQGSYAMKSSCEKVNDTTSSIEIEVNVPYDGFLAFNHKISAEENADFGNFYIDNVLQTTISGNREWRYVEIYVTAGTHTYKWEYTKDGSRHTYADAYFVDDIVFYKETEVKKGWIGYADEKWATSIGTGAAGPTYWGVSFPVTKQYAGLTMTKIAVFDAAKGGTAQYTANIYLGGDNAPETLVSTKQFTLKGSDEMVEVTLTTPVEIDGTQPLWITLYCDQSAYPVATSLKSEYLTTDWLSLDGKEWKHSYEYDLNGTWMVKGYLEDAAGNAKTLAKSGDRGFSSKYNVYRKDLYKNTTELLVENTTETKYTDNAWETMGTGAYKWGVSAIYDGESEIVWSNTVSKDMTTELTVTVETDSNDPVAGTVINLINKVEKEYNYSVTLGLDNVYKFKNFRKGVYEVSILKNGFISDYEGETVEIWDAREIECYLYEDIAPVKNLYVSPTGWVMWEGVNIGAGDEFSFDFEDGTLNGWTTIDADNDNYTWQNSIEIMAPGSGHNSSVACVTSMSWIFGVVLTPDNYLVTERKYRIDETSKLKFWVCAQDAMAPNDHYGVAVSFNSNTNAEDFITIWEETLTAKSGATREQGQWYEKTVDLSDYAGQEIYIALRHFNCTDEFYVNVDDISLETSQRANRALESYDVYLDGKLVAEGLTKPYYQHENLVDGQKYTTAVVPVYSSDEGDEATYTWRKAACDKFEGVANLNAEYSEGVTVVNWTLPETENEGNSGTRDGEWLTYDDGEYAESIGLAFDPDETLSFEWGVMFPKENMAQYANQYLTKVALYDKEAYDGIVRIYKGGNQSPQILLYEQDYQCTGAEAYIEVELDMAVEISGNDNIWVTLYNKNGSKPAAGSADCGNPNGRWISYDGMWIDLAYVSAQTFTWQIRAYVSETEPTTPDADVIGVMLYRNGQIISQLVQGESYTDEKSMAGDEYSLRVVYGGEKDVTYYAMSCPQSIVADLSCPAPKDLKASSMAYGDGRIGTLLKYPYTPPTSEWLSYDFGSMVESVGGLESFYYGVKFPVEKLEAYTGTNLTKVMFYDYVDGGGAHSGTINIYYGGEYAPEILVHTQDYSGTGVGEFVEVELLAPLPVSGDECIWVIMKTNDGMKWPAALSRDCGDANARWFSLDGSKWMDIASEYSIDGSFMIRAFVTNEERGVATSLDPSTRGLTLKNYNIYRGTTLDNIEFVTSTTEKTYFDEVEKGTYYYQVTAVYEENGEECESAPARAYDDYSQNYVMVEVTAIEENGVNGLMVYPNPTNGNLNINVEAMRRITIANALGQIVYDQEVVGDSEIIDMAQYKTGVYMVRIVTDNGVAVERVNVVR